MEGLVGHKIVIERMDIGDIKILSSRVTCLNVVSRGMCENEEVGESIICG